MSNRAEKDRQQAQREMGQQLAKFARDLAAGRTAFVDRFGAKVDKGDFIVWEPPHPMIYEVVDVLPVLNANVVGAVKVVMICNAEMQFFASQRAMNVIKCGTSAKDEATGETKTQLDTPGNEPPTDLPAPGEPVDQVDEPPVEDQLAAQDEAAVTKRDQDQDV